MKIVGVKLFHYVLPFKIPVIIQERKIQGREGFLLELKDSDGICAYGEIAPLVGRSKETLKTILQEMKGVRNFLLQTQLPTHFGSLEGKLQKLFQPCRPSWDVQFGLEMALLNMRAHQKKIPLFATFSETEKTFLPLNGLVLDTSSMKEIDSLIHQGYQTLKIKVRAQNLKQEIKNILAIQRAYGEEVILRLDANQSLTFDQAIELGKTIGPAIEYIEEPFADIERIPEFYEETLIPVALDEALGQYEISKIQSISGVEVLVVKPSTLGGLEASWQLAQQARGRGLHVVISSSFESGVGLLTLGHFALGVSRTTAAGLDTLKYFEKDLLKKTLTIMHGNLDLHSTVHTEDLNFDLLEEVQL
ncbi:MAG: o-succinylbenzoate synthase [Candidatus Omnitrophica bacterium]|nr:o-succinylbenzoate synthase [Candidatus Omnitrophota bacterium]